jgi:hypothetical protein
LNIENIAEVFKEIGKNKAYVMKYLIDSKHSNCLTNPEYPGGIEIVEDSWIEIRNGELGLKHEGLEKNGLVLWEITR